MQQKLVSAMALLAYLIGKDGVTRRFSTQKMLFISTIIDTDGAAEIGYVSSAARVRPAAAAAAARSYKRKLVRWKSTGKFHEDGSSTAY